MSRILHLCLALGAIFFSGISHGAVILADDFSLSSDPVGTSSASIASWNTQSGVTAGTSFTAVDENSSSVNYFSTTTSLSVASTVWSAGDGWDVSFGLVLDAGTASISLSTLDLTAIVMTASGSPRNGGGDRQWTLTITGDNGYGTQSASVTSNFVNSSSPSGQIDLAGLGDLVAGENYTASIGVRYVNGDQTYMALDSIALNGEITPVPEPSLALLGGLGAMLMLRRRRG